jgi:hypothetical protein
MCAVINCRTVLTPVTKMSPFTAIVYPDTGPNALDAVIHASFYFDRVSIMGHHLHTEQEQFYRDLSRNSTATQNWARIFSLPLDRLLLMSAKSSELHTALQPLASEGLLEYPWGNTFDMGLHVPTDDTIRAWLSDWRLPDNQPDLDSLSSILHRSLELTSIPQGDWEMSRFEMHQFVRSILTHDIPRLQTIVSGSERNLSRLPDNPEAVRIFFHHLALIEACALSVELGASLLTNSRHHDAALNAALNTLPGAITQDMQLNSQREARLADAVIQTTVPSLRGLPPEAVLEVRHKLRDELGPFRTEMARLAAYIEAEPWQPTFKREVDNTIAREINPALLGVRRALDGFLPRFSDHLVGGLDSLLRAAIPFLASTYAGAPIDQAAGIGIATALTTAVATAEFDKRSTRRTNALAYVFDLERRAKRSQTATGNRKRRTITRRPGP